MNNLAFLIGSVMFGFGCIGLYGLYLYGTRRTERIVIAATSFCIGGLTMIISSSEPSELDIEMERWKIAHCYGPDHLTEFCVPSIRSGEPIRE